MTEETSLIQRELADLVVDRCGNKGGVFTVLKNIYYCDRDGDDPLKSARELIEELRKDDPLLDSVCAGVTTYSRELEAAFDVDVGSLSGIVRFMFPKEGSDSDLRIKQLQSFLDTAKYIGHERKDGSYAVSETFSSYLDDRQEGLSKITDDHSAHGIKLRRLISFNNALFMGALFGGIYYAGHHNATAFPIAFGIVYSLMAGLLYLNTRMSKTRLIKLGKAVDGMIHKIIPESLEKVVTVSEEPTEHEEELLRKARKLQNNHKYQEAVSILEKAIVQNPHLFGFHYELGNCHIELGNPLKAEESYNNAIKTQQKNNVSAHKALAGIYFASKRYGEAISTLESALQLSPFDKETHTLLFRTYLADEKPMDALISMTRIGRVSQLTDEQKLLKAQAYFMHYAELIQAGNKEDAGILWRRIINEFKISEKHEQDILMPLREAYLLAIASSGRLDLWQELRDQLDNYMRLKLKHNSMPRYDIDATNIQGRIVLGLMGYFYGRHFGNETIGNVLGAAGAFLPETLRLKNFIFGDIPYLIKTTAIAKGVATNYKPSRLGLPMGD